jgi:hypothetical protein
MNNEGGKATGLAQEERRVYLKAILMSLQRRVKARILDTCI